MIRFALLGCFCACLTNVCLAGDVLMVIGGQFYNTTSRHHENTGAVEIVGLNSSCEIHGLPTPLHGMSAARLGDKVVTCGGYHDYYRWQCYEYTPSRGVWVESRVRLTKPSAFMATLATDNEFYVAGGRNFRSGDGSKAENWFWWDSLLKLENDQWQKVVDLPEPLADACLVRTYLKGKRRMWLIGGSNSPQRYKSDVYSIELGSEQPEWKRMPNMPEERMWHVCAFTEVEGEKGILVAGGYYNGFSSMWLPLEDRNGNSLETHGLTGDQPRWEWFSTLTEERKWIAGLGKIGPYFALAGGGAYGDNTVEILSGNTFQRIGVEMRYKREFTAGVTVPSEWFPHCNLQ